MNHLEPLLLLALLLFIPDVETTKFTDCSATSLPCGMPEGLTISYPFRKPGMPQYCGHPEFEISCVHNVSTIVIAKKEYQVQNIIYSTQFLGVLDVAYSVDTCPQTFANTTTDFLFNYSNNSINLTMYFNCFNVSDTSRLKNISCLENRRVGYHSYYLLPDDDPSVVAVDDLLEKCDSVVVIPIYGDDAVPLLKGRVDFLGALQNGFGLNWTVGKEWCGGCQESSGVCGFDQTWPDAQTCFCPDGGTADGTCHRDAVNNRHKKIIIGATGGFAGIIFIILLLLCTCSTKFHNHVQWRKKSNVSQNVEAFLEKYGTLAPKRYTYSDVKKMTHSFNDKLGQGGYGTVYKGSLSDDRLVAVKVLKISNGNGEEFVNEIASIGKSSHVNIVNLLGFCSEGSKRALIYEYMCNGSLDKLLCSEKPKSTLDWERLYQIAIGIARGLEYLHRGCNTRIVHFDIKPHNILLDKDFCPKISDFGLAKLCLRKDSILSMEGMRGTIGYIAPEVFSRNFGVVSSKSDIYSYGMMVLEMAGGRKNMHLDAQNTSDNYFPHYIYKCLEENEDLLTYGVTTEIEGLAKKMILIGLWCIQTQPQNRPPITRVIEMWEGSVDDLQIPPKPNLSLPSTLVSDICSSSIHDGGYTRYCSSAVLQ